MLLYLCRRQRKYAWIHFKMTWCQRIWIILFENKDKELQFLFFTGCGNGTNFVQISYTKKKQIHMLIVAFMLFKNGFLWFINIHQHVFICRYVLFELNSHISVEIDYTILSINLEEIKNIWISFHIKTVCLYINQQNAIFLSLHNLYFHNKLYL